MFAVIREQVLTAENVRYVVDRAFAKVKRALDDDPRPKLKAALADVERREKLATDLWVDHGEVDAARVKLAALKDERAKLEAQFESLAQPPDLDSLRERESSSWQATLPQRFEARKSKCGSRFAFCLPIVGR